MNTYLVTVELPGLREGAHYYADHRVRAGSPEGAERAALRREPGSVVIAVSPVR